MNATVIHQTSSINNNPIEAWFVRHQGKIHGQFHTEGDACQFAMTKLTTEFMQSGTPLDGTAMSECITFEKNTAYESVKH